MKVVAEGIEDWNTYEALRSIGCDIGQGFSVLSGTGPGQFHCLVGGLEDAWLAPFQDGIRRQLMNPNEP